MRVLLAGGGTGGHLMPALALAQALQDAGKGIEPVLVGAERGIEAQVLPRYPFRHHLLPMEPIYRRTWWNDARWLLIAGRAWRAVGRVLEAEQPAIVIGTGGYAAGPVLWRAQRRRLPTVLQEQNAFPGLTTRWLARGARQVHLGFPEAQERLRLGSHTAVFALGNPIRVPEPGPRAADLVVSRAGAMTVAELCAWGKPSILVPLPTAAADHQTRNASALAAVGAAIQLSEEHLSPFTLAEQVTSLLADRSQLDSLGARAKARGHPNAAREIVSRILTLVA